MANRDQTVLSWYEAHYADLHEYGCIITQDPDLVADLLQSLFVWLLEHPESVRAVEKPRPYLMRAFAQNIRKHYFSQRRTHERFLQYSADGTAAAAEEARAVAAPDAAIVLEETLTARETALAACLDQLSPRQREIVYLRYYRRLPFAEISEMLGIKEQVARNVSSRAMRALRGMTASLRDRCFVIAVLAVQALVWQFVL